MPALTWTGILAIEGEQTRELSPKHYVPGSIDWPSPPLTLTENDPNGQVTQCGSITEVWRDGPAIMGSGIIEVDTAVAGPGFEVGVQSVLSAVSGESVGTPEQPLARIDKATLLAAHLVPSETAPWQRAIIELGDPT